MKAFTLAGVLALAMAAGVRAADDKPEVTYKQDGNDLVVSVKVRLNSSPHALFAWVEGTDKEPVLRYLVVQNPDVFNRSLKWTTVEWRLPGKKEADVKVKVDGVTMHAKTADLKGFAEQVKGVVEAGEKRPK